MSGSRWPGGGPGGGGRRGWRVDRVGSVGWSSGGRSSWRCQRRIVAGVTSSPRRRRTGSSRVRAAIRARSVQLIRGRGVRRWSTASWWRRTRISISLVVSDRSLQHDPAQELGEHPVDQPQRHRRIMPGACRDERQVSGCVHSFGHLQGGPPRSVTPTGRFGCSTSVVAGPRPSSTDTPAGSPPSPSPTTATWARRRRPIARSASGRRRGAASSAPSPSRTASPASPSPRTTGRSWREVHAAGCGPAGVSQAPVGCAVTPRMCTRRVACSMTKNAYSRRRVIVSRCEQADARGSRAPGLAGTPTRVVPARRGAGSTPAAWRIVQTVEAPIWTPRPACRVPERGHSA